MVTWLLACIQTALNQKNYHNQGLMVVRLLHGVNTYAIFSFFMHLFVLDLVHVHLSSHPQMSQVMSLQ